LKFSESLLSKSDLPVGPTGLLNDRKLADVLAGAVAIDMKYIQTGRNVKIIFRVSCRFFTACILGAILIYF